MSVTITCPAWCTAQERHAADLAEGESIVHMAESGPSESWLWADLPDAKVDDPDQVLIHVELDWFTIDETEAVVEEIRRFARMLGASPSPETRNVGLDTFKSR